MIRFLGQRLKNVHLYKDAYFDYDYKGLSVIYGRNIDAGPRSTNAAGKSLFFSRLAEILLDTTPLVGKRDKLETGLETIEFVGNDKKTYKVIRTAKAGREKLAIVRNGKDRKIIRKAYAKEALEKLHGWTAEDLFSLVYIDSRRPSALQMGSTAERRDFIIRMFKLSNIDNLRKLFAVELRRIAEDRSAYDEVKRQYKTLTEQLVDESELDLEEKVAKLEKVYKVLSERVHKASAISDLFSFGIENKKNVKRLKKLVPDFAKIDEVVDSHEKEIDRLEECLIHAVAWTKHKDRVEDYKRSAVPILNKLAKYEHISIEKIEKGSQAYDSVESKIRDLRADVAARRKLLPPLEYVEKHILRLDRDHYRTLELKTVERIHRAEKTEGHSQCPTCGQAIPKQLRDIEEEHRKLRKIRRTLGRIEEAVSIRDRQKVRKDHISEINRANLSLRELEARQERLRKYKRAASLYDQLPSKPKVFEGKKYEEEGIRASLQATKDSLEFINNMKPILERIEKAARLTEEDKQEVDNLQVLKIRLDKVVERLPQLRSMLDQMKTNRKLMDELRSRGKELRKSVREEEAYKILVEAYGNAGIKKLMLQRIGKHLQDCLNRYSKYVFSERYEFRINIDTQFDILVKRRLVNRVAISDVRRLSGAESRAFALLLFLSLLSLTPSSRRSNILILDEPDANLGEEMIENFKRFIPILNKIVPHIIIITPHTKIRYPNARLFTVVKKNGYSKLMKGLVE